MSPMEQALRDEIAWHEEQIQWVISPYGPASWMGDMVDKHRARIAALNTAFSANDAVLCSYIDNQISHHKFNDINAAAAPHPPVSLGEISQAQAQAMREALEAMAAETEQEWTAVGSDPQSRWVTRPTRHALKARAALSASPLPAPATPGGPDA